MASSRLAPLRCSRDGPRRRTSIGAAASAALQGGTSLAGGQCSGGGGSGSGASEAAGQCSGAGTVAEGCATGLPLTATHSVAAGVGCDGAAAESIGGVRVGAAGDVTSK